MIPEQAVAQSVTIQKKMYAALTEVAELTTELSEAVNRQDQVSVQIFLSMRQDLIDQLLNCRAQLRWLCAELPTREGAMLRRLNAGSLGESELSPSGLDLLRQVKNNRALLERICQADERVSRSFGGPNSFYAHP